MSHSSHRKAVRDASLPLAYRMSHARSCANHVAARLGVERDVILEVVMRIAAVDLRFHASEDDLMRAFDDKEKLSASDLQRT
jgi:hypothetical protein